MTPAPALRGVPGLADVRRPKLPRVSERVLDSGLRVVACRRPAVPLVHVRLRVPSATRRAEDLARTELLARSAMLGTERHSEEELADLLLGLGGSLHVGADADGFRFAGDALAPELGTLLDTLGEVLTTATFPRGAVEREAQRFAENVRLALSQPPTASADVWARRRYGDHPYARRIVRPEEILAVAPGSLRAAHRRRITPDGGILVVVGDIAPARALDLVEARLAAWTASTKPTSVPRVPLLETGPLVLADRPGSVQSSFRFGGDAPGFAAPSYAATQVADAIFTGLFSSRLIANLREDKGYTYGSYSALRHQTGGSSYVVGVEVATGVSAPALVESIHELGRMVTLPPEPDEVAAAVQYLIGTSMLRVATQSGLADTLLHLLTQGTDVAWLRDHPARLVAVTPEDVLAAAQAILSPSRLVLSVLGDAETIAGPLSSVAEITRVDGA